MNDKVLYKLMLTVNSWQINHMRMCTEVSNRWHLNYGGHSYLTRNITDDDRDDLADNVYFKEFYNSPFIQDNMGEVENEFYYLYFNTEQNYTDVRIYFHPNDDHVTTICQLVTVEYSHLLEFGDIISKSGRWNTFIRPLADRKYGETGLISISVKGVDIDISENFHITGSTLKCVGHEDAAWHSFIRELPSLINGEEKKSQSIGALLNRD